eukprot:gb/GEZN01007896.1/.p1 GENE.gb/GEZN01007896.1/~~gb/GEZN01007896.1/.p1  ORF type:complete len:414 (+),score=19.14 gb/GEZN01007896.1/:1-1242(+)
MKFHGVEKVRDDHVVYQRKARLVARGDQLDKSRDCGPTFAPTPSTLSTKYFYAHTVAEGLFNDQDDITAAYLHAQYTYQSRPIYFRPPPGADEPGIVWRPKVAWYGTPDAVNLYWYNVLVPFILSQDFIEDPLLPCLFHRKCPVTKKTEVLEVWSDNLNKSFSSVKRLKDFADAASKHFKGYKSEPTTRFAGWDVKDWVDDKGVRKIKLYQETQANKMIDALNMQNATPVSVPWLPNGQLPSRASQLEQFSPHVIMGNLITFRGTRPDIRAVVSELAEKQSKPEEFDFMGAEQVIRYIKGTKTKGIIFRSDAPKTIGKCGFDASHVPKRDLRSRMGGYLMLMGADVDDFSNKIKNVTPLSTCESETYAGSEHVRRALVLRNVIEAFGENQVFDTSQPVVIECDNEATVKNFER